MPFFHVTIRLFIAAMVIHASFFEEASLGQIRPALDPDLVSYFYPEDREPISGKLTISGSNTMSPLMQAWVDGLREKHPNLKVMLSEQGSKTGLEALLEHRTEVAALSHRMTASELSEFVKEYGYEPTEVPVAIDALAVFVHQTNPITGLSLEELDAMFCQERRRGLLDPIDTWGAVGLDGEWFSAPVHLYGRNAQSGTSAFFREEICQGGPLSSRLMEKPGSASVILEMETDQYGIGFSSIGYRTSYVKPVPIATVKGGRYVEPTFASVADGSYPLRRNLYLYIAKPPKTSSSPAVIELLRFALSRQGQKLALDLGYYPLSSQEIGRTLANWSRSMSSAQTSAPDRSPSQPGS
ncbi:MAG: phosphate ABC transporter substrate-binding protein [Nitrospira sp.]|nr:phosphate ABC transporter substrate-binding protein [Nitrospira sp.]MCP9443018.1 phosphate ABC transporter substrate-binding protein [Nitrospira sp.]